jgi:hypothetical protein
MITIKDCRGSAHLWTLEYPKRPSVWDAVVVEHIAPVHVDHESELEMC